MRHLNSSHPIGKHLLLLLALSGMLHFALASSSHTSTSQRHKDKNSATEQFDCYQALVVPITESNLVVSSVAFQYTSDQENNSRVCAAFFHHQLTIASQFAQFMHCLQTIGLNYRKADRLFPSHYFW